MGTILEYDVCRERDIHQVATGRWIWTVFDPVSSGALKDGVEDDKAMAHISGRTALSLAQIAEDCRTAQEPLQSVEDTIADTAYKYEDVMPVDSYQSTPWLVEFDNGCKQIQLWHSKAIIKDIVEAMKMQYPNNKFTVAAVDVGVFTIGKVEQCLSNGRKVNQDMNIHIDI
jgi:hypothetical protein